MWDLLAQLLHEGESDTAQQDGVNVPRFLRVLYTLLHDEDDAIVSWSADKTCFQVHDIERLEAHVLPKYFKHSRFASFQRQLNSFGFHKWTKSRAAVCTFSHDKLIGCAPEVLAEVYDRTLPKASRHPCSKRPRTSSTSSETSITSDYSECEVDEERLPLVGKNDIADLNDLDEMVVGALMGPQQASWKKRKTVHLFVHLEESDIMELAPEHQNQSTKLRHESYVDCDYEPLSVAREEANKDSVHIDDWQLQVLIECLSQQQRRRHICLRCVVE
ncbi:TPA: hypothetical protein N0F65_010725 [Lagenidium giganteum]|uniref:HSF-type DNA-binding domain-containing protein n=1 Tax=Lagenidium giganteum TaxID=4803 RepID=A0AAV2YLE5_9STRA|nr:TPA: hypothetical protein N0F65_010725 [Lagenidium giganteum]